NWPKARCVSGALMPRHGIGGGTRESPRRMTVAVGAVIDDPHDVAGAAAEAEKVGYDYIACGEHLLFHGETPNSFVRLATAAGATQRVRLMNTVTVAPLYPPALFAKLVADLAVVSGERL